MIKSYPRSQFDIVDQTNIQEIAQQATEMPLPMTMAAATFDKGPEDWRLIMSLDDLTKEYGSISFVKHGQGQLTVADQLRSGAAVLLKRMVSEDAALANVTIRARVVNSDNISYVYFYAKSGVEIANFDTACEVGYDSYNPDSEANDFPLFTVTPMGRGVSNMFFRINPNYTSAKSSTYVTYSFEVYENQQLLESILFTMNPDIVINGVSQALNPKIKANSKQIKVNLYEDGLYGLISALSLTAKNGTNPIPVNDLINLDFLNGVDRRGSTPIGGIVTKTQTNESADLWASNKPEDIITAYDLSDAYGIPLTGGTYGSMGETPLSNPQEYERMLLGTYGANHDSRLHDNIIYDLDAYKVDFIVDANYSFSVKNAIINLCDFRQDMIFLCDLGTTATYYTPISEAVGRLTQSRFCAVFHPFFKVYDPYTHKQIQVTLPYLLSSRLIKHINNGVGRPFCGILNGITFPEIINGTLNYMPVEIPGVNQKLDLVDLNVNYINYYDGIAVLETSYVNYDKYSQLSFMHNIMLVQRAIKDIRAKCPKARYTFMDGSDLDKYIDDANTILNQYAPFFKSITMKYMADELYENNNIYYATVIVEFKNFINEELFRVIAVS